MKQIAPASAYRGARAPGETRPIAVAAASDEVACADGNDSRLGADASGGRRRSRGRERRTASFTR